MRIMVFFLLVGVSMSYANDTYSQSAKLSISLKNKTIKEAFSEIEKISEYIFLYNDDNLDVNQKVSVNAQNQTIDKVLTDLFKNTDNTYYVSDRQVFISKKKSTPSNADNIHPQVNEPVQDTRILIKGIIKDKDGEPLIGVTVKPKGKGAASISGLSGEFMVYVENMNETLIFSYVGMKEQQVRLKAGVTEYNVVMEYSESELGAVVVEAGIIQRDQLGFTGSYKQLTKEELRSVGNINVIQSLRSLDPSIAIAENSLRGSDPNTMANITLRGGSAMNVTSTFDDVSVNPNQPLFILDGFETTLQIINDIDINRIESITILKDAGSTAIYGSKGGNGVIIVETVKPKAGQLRLSYNGNMQLSMADLSVYNMMNASEKLEFELKAGRYGNINDYLSTGQSDKISDYYSRLGNVMSGIDTYWLKVPIRTGLTQDHSVNIDGGEKSGMLYQVGLQFRNMEGVMKGSSRQTFGGNVRLQYRKENINIMNNLSVSVTNGQGGSWGSFQDFVQANPYYRMMNDDGTIPEFLDSLYEKDANKTRIAPNPYYNAMLASRNDTKNLSIVNNTNFDWYILPNLRWISSLQIQTNRGEGVSFKDPRHTDFDGLDYTLQGTYNSNKDSDWSYEVNSRLVHTLSIKDAHNMSFVGRASVKSIQGTEDGYIATGFPKGVPGIPSYSYGYEEGSRPGYSDYIKREANFLLALDYNYKLRYLLNFNLNSDGSTAFGRNNKFQTFWAVGAGWNVDQEPFAENWDWMNRLKIRGSFGHNGNQNVSAISANVYSYFPGNDVFGASAYLSQFGNPNLRWQVVKKTSAGIDLTAVNNRLNVTFDAYLTKTDPLVLDLDQKPSSGVSKYYMNLGNMQAKGLELSASYQIINDVENGVLLSVRGTASTGKVTYDGFASALENLNESYKKEEDVNANLNKNSLVRYRDGNSPDDLWAVRSLGIDPATGQEIFLDRFGTPTFTYNADDRVVIASMNPDVEGIFGFTFRFKELTANFNFRYSIGGYRFNDALHRKVENITPSTVIYNQDKRALYDRWQNPGDISAFKGIGLITMQAENTPISSRFIQRNDYLSGESARISWDFSNQKWIKTLGMSNMTLSLSYSDLFYLSTMKRERSIDYPFARSITMGLSAQF